MISRRTLLTGGLGLFLLPPGSALLAVAATAVRAGDYRRAGDRDDTLAFERALATGNPVHAPAGGGSGPGGAYEVTGCRLPGGATIFGDGDGTVLRPRAGEPAIRADSGASDRSIRGLTLRDLKLHGRVEQAGFREHSHLVRLDGVEDVLIERVSFTGFQGDGLYLASGIVPGQERHNRRLVIRSCRFDGVNLDNRNAISIIDGDDVRIEDCTFRNCTRPNMPGPIDLEPDPQSFAIIRNIVVERCLFENNGGSVAQVAIQIPAVVALPRNIAIRNNEFRNYRGSGAEIAINVMRATSESDPDMGVTITGNRGQGGNSAYLFVSGKGMRASANSWTDYKGGGLIGYTEPASLARDVVIADRFTRCGRVAGVGIAVFQAVNLRLEDTQIIDAGVGTPGSYGILFAAGGRSRNVSLRRVTVHSRATPGFQAVGRQAGHRLEVSTNAEQDNDFGGLPAVSIVAG